MPTENDTIDNEFLNEADVNGEDFVEDAGDSDDDDDCEEELEEFLNELEGLDGGFDSDEGVDAK